MRNIIDGSILGMLILFVLYACGRGYTLPPTETSGPTDESPSLVCEPADEPVLYCDGAPKVCWHLWESDEPRVDRRPQELPALPLRSPKENMLLERAEPLPRDVEAAKSYEVPSLTVSAWRFATED